MNIDSQVLKLKDSRIEAVLHGRLALQNLVFTIHPGDWLILYKNTIYTLTEDQYYASQGIVSKQILSKQQFEKILQQPFEDFSDIDKVELKYIKDHKNNCSFCKYNRFKAKLLQILKKYPDKLKKYKLLAQIPQVKQYPAVKDTIVSKVSKIFPIFFQRAQYTRKPCLDCVQKHLAQATTLIGQAYIKGCQTLQGYPEHLDLAIANLQQAYEECPKDCQQLRETLMFCIGKSKKQNKLFVPIDALLYLIQIARNSTSIDEALDNNQINESFALQLNTQCKAELAKIPIPTKAILIKKLNQIIALQYSEPDKYTSFKYQGLMANLADQLVNFSVEAANILRNRRLLFKASVQLTRDSEYDCKDFIAALKESQL